MVLVGGEDICFLCPPAFEIDLAPRTRVSLFPMGPVRGCLSEGLRWPIDGLAFAPDGRIGTSNEATGGLVRVVFDAPRMLVILPAGLLEPVVDRLRGARGSGLALSVIVTATASVIVTSTRDPGPCCAAKLRRSGGTTVRRVKSSGVRKIARPRVRIVGFHRHHHALGGDRGRAGYRPSGARPATIDAVGSPVSLGMPSRASSPGSSRPYLVAGRELRQVADLGTGGDGEGAAAGVVGRASRGVSSGRPRQRWPTR